MNNQTALFGVVLVMAIVMLFWMVYQFVVSEIAELTSQTAGNISEIRKDLENLNVTVLLTQNDTVELEQSGAISGLTKPQIIPHN